MYDEVLIDETSFSSNYRREENLILSNIADACTFINLKEGQEEIIYKKVFEKLKAKSSAAEDYYYKIKNIKTPKYHYYSDVFNDSSYNKFLSSINTGTFQKFYNENETKSTFQEYFYHVIRYFYYIELQHFNSSELVIHPNRNELVQSFSNYQKIYTNQIIKNFDDGVRKGVHTRKKEWLGVADNSLFIPMVASYVFNKCKSWEDLYKVIIDVKNSKEAILFRKGLSELINAFKNNNLIAINDTLSSLEEAKEKWNQSLKSNPSKQYKTITFSIPMIGGIGIDVDIPYSFGNNISSKLLTFIHKMILGS